MERTIDEVFDVKNNVILHSCDFFKKSEHELMQRGFLITARLLRDAVTDKVEALNEKTMFQVFAEHNEEQRKLVGKGLSKATYWVSIIA